VALAQLLSSPISDDLAGLDLEDQVGSAFSWWDACPELGLLDYTEGCMDSEVIAQHAAGCPLCQELIGAVVAAMMRVRLAHGLTGLDDYESFRAQGIESEYERWQRHEADRKAREAAG
jgi:hypothetical protein